MRNSTKMLPVTTWKIETTIFDPRMVSLREPVVKVGRDVKNHIVTSGDPAVSRMHTVIEATNPEKLEVDVIDLGSGTYIGGNSISKASLKIGEYFMVGATKITLTAMVWVVVPVSVEPAKPVAPPPQPAPIPTPTATKTYNYVVPPPVTLTMIAQSALGVARKAIVRGIAKGVRLVRQIEAEDRKNA